MNANRNLKLQPALFVLISDLFLISMGLLAALLLNFRILHIQPFEVIAILISVSIHLMYATIIWLIAGVSKRVIRHFHVKDYVKLIGLLALLHIASGSFAFFLDKKYILTNEVWVLSFFATSFFMLVSRLFFSYWYHYRLDKINSKLNKRLLIYGAGILGLTLKKSIESNPQSGFRIMGFLDDDFSKKGKFIEGIEVFHANEQVQQTIARLGITDVIFATKSITAYNKSNFLQQAIIFNINIRELPSLEKWFNSNFNLQSVEEIEVEDLLNRDSIQIHNESLDASLEGKTILVTGAGGSIGSELVQTLVKYPLAKMLCVDMAESPLFELQQKLLRGKIEVPFQMIIGDIRNAEEIQRLMHQFKPDFVYHAAAYKHVPLMESYPEKALQTNVLGTWNCAIAAAAAGVSKFIFVSTDKAINPTSVMGCSKRIAEMSLQMLSESHPHTQFITTRFGNVLGSNGSVVPLFKQQIKKGGPVTITHPDMVRYFMTIPEAASLVVEASVMGKEGEVFIFDMGSPVKIKDLAYNMIKLAGLVPEKDITIEYTGIRPGEKLYEDLFADQEQIGKTHHKKIMIGKVSMGDTDEIMSFLHRLMQGEFIQMDPVNMKMAMKKLVPNYVPMV